MTCEICGNRSTITEVEIHDGVSFESCLACYDASRMPWGVLVGEILSRGLGRAQAELQTEIEATCAFYGRSVQELLNEVDAAESQYHSLQQGDGNG